MGDWPVTSSSLLVRIRDAGDRQAWAKFAEVYAPLVYGYARRQGLQDADAADLTQETLRAVAGAARSLAYDPARGSFRGWLFTVARNELRTYITRRLRKDRGSGDTAANLRLAEQPARDDEAAEWDRQYRQRAFAWAAEQVRPGVQDSTWQAFWQTAVEGRSGQQVAQALGMSVAAVYLAKSRIMARLKEQIRLLDEDEIGPP